MSAPLDTVVSIETPEHIVFRHRVAGPARRALAHVLDLLLCYSIVAAVFVLVALIVAGSGGFFGLLDDSFKAGIGLLLILLFVAQWVWFAAWEGFRGATPGKRLLGLQVVTINGRPIGPAQAMLRNVLRAADLLPTMYVVGVVTMIIGPRFQRLGDLVAGTMVVAVDRASGAASRPPTHVLWPPPQPWELAALPSGVTLDADERAALELFLRRRVTLGQAREHELASMIAAGLAAKHGWQGPVLDPVRTLFLLYDRALATGRGDAPVSVREPLPNAEPADARRAS
jgi:uncharacterized RDD family membrane protein YckC